MNKKLFMVITAIMLIPVIASATPTASPVAPSTGDAVSTVASTNVTASTVTAPSTGSAVTTVVTVTPPSTGSAVSTVTVPSETPVVAPPSTGAAVSTVTTSSSGSTGGSSSNVSESSNRVYSSSGGRARSITNSNITLGNLTMSCPIITSNLGLGMTSKEVTNLQSFLKYSQKLDVDVTGIFDQKTVEAVKAFQTKYADVILTPWQATLPSGYVGMTTIKKINQLACNIPLTLNSTELAVLNSRGTTAVESNDSTQVQSNETIVVDNSATPAPEVSEDQNTENTATVKNTSIFQRFLKFLKSLF